MIRRVLAALFCIAIFCVSSISVAHPKIDPYLDDSAEGSDFKALSLNVPPPAEDADLLDVFIKAADSEAVAELVRAAGGQVRVVTGPIMTALIPPGSLETIADSEAVIFIEASKPVRVSADVAASEIGIPQVHQGLDLPDSYTGEGVIVGIVDTGVDYTHPDFLDSEGVSRILAIWDQGKSRGLPPSEIEDGYGVECEYDSITSGECSLVDVEGHGTHVAGIAAGNDDVYRGVAPDSNIIAVKYDARLDLETGYADALFSTKICEAAYYIFAKAAQYGRPAVVNLSLGTHLGAHDGTSLFEQCMSELVADQAGRAIVAAAGNEYSGDGTYTGIHAGFDPEGGKKATNFVILNRTSDGVYYIDLWGDAGSDLSVGLAINRGTPDGPPLQKSYMAARGDKVSGTFLSGDVRYMINATEGSSPLNGKPHVGIRIVLDSDLDNPSAYSFDLVVAGTGSFDAWLFPDKPARTIQFTSVSGSDRGDYDYVSGDRVKSIAIPATSPDVIAVAGYVTRTRWTAGALTWVFNGQELGALLNFSSSGPTADFEYTGQKPEIAAPGGMIAAALSAYASVSSQVVVGDGDHFMQAGTSMAAPFVSGTIALMFEHNANFTQGDVERFMIESAYVDSFVGSAPNDRWGYGKLDALSAMEIAVTSAASGTFDAEGSIAAPSSQTPGKSGCSLVTGAAASGVRPWAGLAAVMLAAMAIALRRRSIRTDNIW